MLVHENFIVLQGAKAEMYVVLLNQLVLCEMYKIQVHMVFILILL